ncbi:MAG: sugar transferase [Actinomycetota bacterium]|nr:sugar transferase [Actinomycetota bacterium]
MAASDRNASSRDSSLAWVEPAEALWGSEESVRVEPAPRVRLAALPQHSTERREPIPWRARLRHLARRTFDVAFAVLVLAVAAPLLALTILAIRMESPGPALFRQKRMGRGGRIFHLVKLRGMYVDAPARFPELYAYGAIGRQAVEGLFFHTAEDPRVTRVGRVIRKLSIDELPNFWNVLRGEMSIVGPRPEIPELAHLYGSHLAKFLSVKPGVTSPAKATGRDSLSFADTLAQELSYVEQRSFRRDVATIGRTAVSVVAGKNVS